MRRIDQIIVAIIGALAVAALGFVAFTSFPAQPMPHALDALGSDNQVSVAHEPWWIFRPRSKEPTVGLIIYPGALVDARAYAPTARAIASKGYVVVITPMLFNLALFGEERAKQVTPFFPKVRQWALAGHSLGGTAAANYVGKNEGVRGLVLWASYPADNNDLSRRNLIAASIYGTNDTLATPDKILGARTRLPAATKFIAIEGGNHAQFGWYGAQSGDGAATLAREQQQEQIVNATLDVLQQLEHLP
ncbi:MAG: alpha/beta hydrolase [Chloroflexi bacterium]|nr:alpha/beta hydrolase [Chloroflexota bacterium]